MKRGGFYIFPTQHWLSDKTNKNIIYFFNFVFPINIRIEYSTDCSATVTTYATPQYDWDIADAGVLQSATVKQNKNFGSTKLLLNQKHYTYYRAKAWTENIL